MSVFLQEHRIRKVLPVVALTLAALTFFLYLPLNRRAASLDAPLKHEWNRLAAYLGSSNAVSLDFTRLTNNLQETREAYQLLEKTRREALARIQLPAPLRARLQTPFQLVDYENERGKELDELAALAKKAGVTVDPPVYAGFPAYTAGVLQPSLLWAELAMVDGLLKAALECGITGMHNLEVQSSPAVTGGTTALLSEVPILFEFTGAVSNVLNLLKSLPLRTEEVRASGLPGAVERPPVYIDRIIMRKERPEKVDQVRVLVRLAAFVYQE